MSKIGRNDACPCGSGKKYKQCCLNADSERGDKARKSPAHGVQRAIEWLEIKHPDQLREALHEGFFGCIEDEDWPALQALGEEVFNAIMINAMEWVLAEGLCEYRGEDVLIGELILGRGGPLLTVDQRKWIQELMARPISLYEIVETRRGEGFILRDMLEPGQEPLYIHERTASQSAQPFDVIAARIVRDQDHLVLSGAIYPFRRPHAMELIDFIEEERADHLENGFGPDALVSLYVIEAWLGAYIDPPAMPTIVDQTTGEAILFVTDHYRVKDWARLERRFGDHESLEGSRSKGWLRFFTGEDGMVRSTLAIEVGNEPDRIQVSYHTQLHADEGKIWLDGMAGDLISFVLREISDPRGLMKKKAGTRASPEASSPEKSSINPDVLHALIEKRLHEVYADWESQPIPMLNDLTPLEAIKTKRGLAKVKDLIHTYEHGEAQQAKAQNRPVISYAFLWERLGLTPK